MLIKIRSVYMKKVLAIMLSVIMLLGVMPMMAFAENGPADVNWAFVQFFAAGEDEVENIGVVYGGKKVYNDAVAGATYDKATNTLTLDNYNNPDVGLSINMMGDDFKLNVVGNCALACIVSYGDDWGGSLTIGGSGTLTVNEKKYSGEAISLLAEHTASILTVDKGVTVKLYAGEETGVFGSFANLIDDADDLVIAKSGQTVFEISGEPYVDESNVFLTGYEITDADATRDGGYVTALASDPDGVYGTNIWTRSDGSPEYHVAKYVHSDAYGVDFEDPAFVEEYGTYGEVALSQEEFDEAGFSMTPNGNKRMIDAFCYDGDFSASGYKIINAADPNGIYMIDGYYSYDTYQDYESYTFTGTIYKLVLNEFNSTELDEDFEPIAVGTDEEFAPLPAGYSLALADEYDEVSVQGRITSYSGSLYLDSEENEYLVYNYWSSGTDYHYVYALTPVSDVDGVYLATLTDIDYETLTEYYDTTPTDMYNYWTEVREFTFTGDGSGEEPFKYPDVADNAWYNEAAYYNAERGWITGYKNGNFGGADQLKRQDFVVILARIAGADLSAYENVQSTMPDVVKGSYYAAAVNWAVDNGIIGGYTSGAKAGKFGVGDPITREQVCVILYRQR